MPLWVPFEQNFINITFISTFCVKRSIECYQSVAQKVVKTLNVLLGYTGDALAYYK